MKRRTFLKGLVGGFAALTVPWRAPSEPELVPPPGGWKLMDEQSARFIRKVIQQPTMLKGSPVKAVIRPSDKFTHLTRYVSHSYGPGDRLLRFPEGR